MRYQVGLLLPLVLCHCAHSSSPVQAVWSPPPPKHDEPAANPNRTSQSETPATGHGDAQARHADSNDLPEATVMQPSVDSSFVTHPDGWDPNAPQPGDEADGPAVAPKALARSTLAMALALCAQKTDEPGNLLFSPYDLMRLLVMTQAGANQNSAEEIGSVLDAGGKAGQVIAGLRVVSDTFSQGNELHGGNGVLIAKDTGLSSQMKTKLVQAFGNRLEHRRVDDVAQGAQNFLDDDKDAAWGAADKNTAQVWANLSLGTSRVALLGSTRFLSHWEGKKGKAGLLARHQQARSFTPAGGVSSYDGEGYRAVELAAGQRFGLVLVYPKKAGIRKPPPIAVWQSILEGLKPQSGGGPVPALTLSTNVNLTAAVRALGMTSLFDAHKAELSNLGPVGNGLYAKDLEQGAVLELNEQGVRMSAYSALKFNSGGSSKAKRKPGSALETPFYLLLRDTEWSMPLLFGRIETL